MVHVDRGIWLQGIGVPVQGVPKLLFTSTLSATQVRGMSNQAWVTSMRLARLLKIK